VRIYLIGKTQQSALRIAFSFSSICQVAIYNFVIICIHLLEMNRASFGGGIIMHTSYVFFVVSALNPKTNCIYLYVLSCTEWFV